ncbi:CPBP family intramembrane metalloprotease [Candidatus Thorarchaeota archaeon]|nr:MAG: CPBP family intramembrane metalloprotease [Candidatus Thorarchaeota archaeon]
MIEWLIALGIGLTISVIIYSLSFSIMMIVKKKGKMKSNIVHSNPWMTSAVVSPFVLLLSFAAIFFLSSGSLQLWGFQIPSVSTITLLGSIGLIVACIILFVSEHLSPTPDKMNPPEDRRSRVLFFIFIVLLASVSEEILFRGFLQNILDNTILFQINFEWFSITSGAIVSAILFGLIHVAPAKQMGLSVPVLSFSAMILGLFAGIFLTISGSLILPIMLHIEFNFVGFMLGISSKSP